MTLILHACIIMYLYTVCSTVCVCLLMLISADLCDLPGSAVRDPAQGGGPQTCLSVSAGQPKGHVQLPAAPRGREGAHLPRGEREKSDWIHTQLQQHTAKIHTGQQRQRQTAMKSKTCRQTCCEMFQLMSPW